MSRQPKILIVDDVQELLDVICEYMEIHGYTVHTTTESQEALRLIEATKYDIIISDIHMPEMDGLELMAWIKNKHPGVPVILITGYSVSEARKIAMEKGADAFFAKPVHMKEIIGVVANLLNNTKQAQQKEDKFYG
jgi:CheY-like chemotaxis protein